MVAQICLTTLFWPLSANLCRVFARCHLFPALSLVPSLMKLTVVSESVLHPLYPVWWSWQLCQSLCYIPRIQFDGVDRCLRFWATSRVPSLMELAVVSVCATSRVPSLMEMTVVSESVLYPVYSVWWSWQLYRSLCYIPCTQYDKVDRCLRVCATSRVPSFMVDRCLRICATSCVPSLIKLTDAWWSVLHPVYPDWLLTDAWGSVIHPVYPVWWSFQLLLFYLWVRYFSNWNMFCLFSYLQLVTITVHKSWS